MEKFGLIVVALLTVLCGALGCAVVALPSSAFFWGQQTSGPASSNPASSNPASPRAITTNPATPDPATQGQRATDSVPSAMPSAPAAVVPNVRIVDAAVQSPALAAAPPAQIAVASLGVDVPITPVGLDSAGNMELPADPALAGWYKYGPAPESAAGATVVAAHVDSLRYGIGPFAALADAEPGTEIVVTDDTGTARTYVVTSVDTTDKSEVEWASVFDRTGPPRLIVVTCGGEFDYSTRHYLSNVIILATPVG